MALIENIPEQRSGCLSLEKTLQDIASTWQQKRQGPQIYLADFTLFNDREGKRWFYAKKDEIIVGILLLSKIKSTNGWLITNIFTTEDAPHGISELLVINTLRVLAKDHCQSVIAGPVPTNHLGEIIGLGMVSKFIVRWIYQISKKIFHLSGREAFWNKFQPTISSSYLLFPDKNLSYSSIRSLFKALNAHT